MAIPPRFTSELRDRLTLSEIIGRRVPLKRAGREFKGNCPFHKEKSPSFYVNDDKQFYHCFGCGAHGDAIGFVMQHDNLSFIEAVEALAAQAGMQVPQQAPQDIERSRLEKSLYNLMEDAAQWFEAQLRLPANRPALQYMRDRGVSEEMLSCFRVGFAPEDRQALRTYLRGKGYTDQQMIDVGLTKISERGGDPYVFFRERIIFPVADRRGRIVAFGGRILPDHLRPPERGDYKPAKYVNSAETTLFHKGRVLYSESRARLAAAEGQPVIVVEGYVDVMACFQAGFRGAVAPMGTALTDEQITALWKAIPGGHKAPVLCFDGDAAGRRAAQRAAGNLLPLLQPDHTVLIAFLPEGQDPDSLIRAQGRGAFQSVLDAAVPLVDFLWTHYSAGRRLDTPEAKAGLRQGLDELVLRIADRSVQQYYRQAFNDRLYNAFGRTWQKGKGGRNGGPAQAPVIPLRVSRPVSGDETIRRGLLAALINYPAIFGSIEEELGLFHLENNRLDQLRQAVLSALEGDSSLDSAGLQAHLMHQGFTEELGLVLSDRVYTHAGFARPGSETDEKALSGWQETWRSLHRQTVGKELEDAGRALARELSEENGQRWIALHNVHKAQDG